DRPERRRAAGRAGLPGDAEVTAHREAHPRLTEHDPRLDADALERERGLLERTWAGGRGVIAWLSEVDHKAIGRRFIVTAFAFFALAGLLAALLRIHHARPCEEFLYP